MKRANKAPEPTTMAVTIRAPSSTARASHGRGSSLTLGKIKLKPERTTYPKRRGLRAASIVLLLVLLVAPIYALSRIAPTIDWRLLVIFPLGLSSLAFVAYWSDKQRAEAGEWRVPESTLHFFSLLGGWPGAFLAQRAFRHKTAKVSFQVVFWLIVALHQFVALDSLLGWGISKDAISAAKRKTA